MTERAARAASFLPAGPLALFGLYLIVMLVQAALLAPSGRSGDLETLLLAQSLEWGYHAKNPPAFYWLAHGMMAATGPSLPVIYALRLAGIFAMVAGLYALARQVQPDPLLAAVRRLRRARHAALPLVPDVPPDQHRAGAGAGAGGPSVGASGTPVPGLGLPLPAAR